MPRADVVNKLIATRELDRDVANAVLDAVTLVPRDDFMAIGPDAVPWRFNRNMSYVRRPLILQTTSCLGLPQCQQHRSVLVRQPYVGPSCRQAPRLMR